jgi:hypothetical protein
LALGSLRLNPALPPGPALHALLDQVTANAVVCGEQQSTDDAVGSAPGRRG